MVQDVYPLDIGEWYKRKYSLAGKRIASAGSCFAQHIGHALRRNGFNYVDVEPAPGFLAVADQIDYGYGLYSGRYGNIYTSRQLLQLALRATGQFEPSEQAWNKGEGFVDPFRPEIEPEPLSSPDAVEEYRQVHLKAIASLFKQTDVFIFTFGLTETWASKADGAAFPNCPGVAGGTFDAERYDLLNLTYGDVVDDMERFFEVARTINPNIHFLLTVSPVPLVATANNDQVIVATTYSKSILRAAAGFLSKQYDFIDYFPAYEIISSSPMRGMFFNPDMRTVSAHGVQHVMTQFFAEHTPPRLLKGPPHGAVNRADRERIACEEQLLSVFGNRER